MTRRRLIWILIPVALALALFAALPNIAATLLKSRLDGLFQKAPLEDLVAEATRAEADALARLDRPDLGLHAPADALRAALRRAADATAATPASGLTLSVRDVRIARGVAAVDLFFEGALDGGSIRLDGAASARVTPTVRGGALAFRSVASARLGQLHYVGRDFAFVGGADRVRAALSDIEARLAAALEKEMAALSAPAAAAVASAAGAERQTLFAAIDGVSPFEAELTPPKVALGAALLTPGGAYALISFDFPAPDAAEAAAETPTPPSDALSVPSDTAPRAAAARPATDAETVAERLATEIAAPTARGVAYDAAFRTRWVDAMHGELDDHGVAAAAAAGFWSRYLAHSVAARTPRSAAPDAARAALAAAETGLARMAAADLAARLDRAGVEASLEPAIAALAAHDGDGVRFKRPAVGLAAGALTLSAPFETREDMVSASGAVLIGLTPAVGPYGLELTPTMIDLRIDAIAVNEARPPASAPNADLDWHVELAQAKALLGALERAVAKTAAAAAAAAPPMRIVLAAGAPGVVEPPAIRAGAVLIDENGLRLLADLAAPHEADVALDGGARAEAPASAEAGALEADALDTFAASFLAQERRLSWRPDGAASVIAVDPSFVRRVAAATLPQLGVAATTGAALTRAEAALAALPQRFGAAAPDVVAGFSRRAIAPLLVAAESAYAGLEVAPEALPPGAASLRLARAALRLAPQGVAFDGEAVLTLRQPAARLTLALEGLAPMRLVGEAFEARPAITAARVVALELIEEGGAFAPIDAPLSARAADGAVAALQAAMDAASGPIRLTPPLPQLDPDAGAAVRLTPPPQPGADPGSAPAGPERPLLAAPRLSLSGAAILVDPDFGVLALARVAPAPSATRGGPPAAAETVAEAAAAAEPGVGALAARHSTLTRRMLALSDRGRPLGRSVEMSDVYAAVSRRRLAEIVNARLAGAEIDLPFGGDVAFTAEALLLPFERPGAACGPAPVCAPQTTCRQRSACALSACFESASCAQPAARCVYDCAMEGPNGAVVEDAACRAREAACRARAGAERAACARASDLAMASCERTRAAEMEACAAAEAVCVEDRLAASAACESRTEAHRGACARLAGVSSAVDAAGGLGQIRAEGAAAAEGRVRLTELSVGPMFDRLTLTARIEGEALVTSRLGFTPSDVAALDCPVAFTRDLPPVGAALPSKTVATRGASLAFTLAPGPNGAPRLAFSGDPMALAGPLAPSPAAAIAAATPDLAIRCPLIAELAAARAADAAPNAALGLSEDDLALVILSDVTNYPIGSLRGAIAFAPATARIGDAAAEAESIALPEWFAARLALEPASQ